MRRFLKQMGFVFVGIFLLLSVLDILFTWILSERPVYGIGRNERVDYLILGDSRCDPLNAAYLSSLTGKKVTNISSNALTFDEIVTLVDYFFKNGNTADTVFVQVDRKLCTYTEPQKEFQYHAHLLRQNGLFSPRIPFVFYLSNRGKIKPSMVFGLALSGFTSGKMESQKDEDEDKEAVATSFTVIERYMEDNSGNVFRIDDIVDLRKRLFDYGVKEVVAFTAPHLPAWITTQADSASFKVAIRDKGLEYVDLSYAYSDTAYFKDHLHISPQKFKEFNRDFIRRMTTGRAR